MGEMGVCEQTVMATYFIVGEPRISPTKFLVKDAETGKVLFVEDDNTHAETAIQEALDNLPIVPDTWGTTAQVGKIFLDIHGTWEMSAPLTKPVGAPRCYVDIEGITPWASILKLADNSDCSMIDWDGPFIGSSIRNLCFYANKANQGGVSPTLDFEWLQDGEFKFVWVEANKGAGILVNRGWSFAFRNCWIEHGDDVGIKFEAALAQAFQNMLLEHLTMIANLQHIYMDDMWGSYIKNSFFGSSQTEDIYIGMGVARNLKIQGNTFKDGSLAAPGTYDSIKIATNAPPERNIITGNTFECDDSVYHSAVGLYHDAHYPIVEDNIVNGCPPIYIDSSGIGRYGKLCDLRLDEFIDCLPVTANHVVNAEDLSAGIAITCIIANQPDVPRRLSWSLTHANITAFTIVFSGTDMEGRSWHEIFTEADGWSGTTERAYAWVTSVRVTERTGTGAGDTLDFGVIDVLGLRGEVYNTDNIILVERITGGVRTNETANVTATRHHIDMSGVNAGGGIVNGDDFKVRYQASINVFKY